MKRLLFFILLMPALASAQSLDVLLAKLNEQLDDTTRVKTLAKIATAHTNHEIGRNYALKAMALSRKINWQRGIAISKEAEAMIAYYKSDFPQAEKLLVETSEEFKKAGDWKKSIWNFVNAGSAIMMTGDHSKSVWYYTTAIELSKKHKVRFTEALATEGVATVYSRQNNLDKAIEYGLKAFKINKEDKRYNFIASSAHLLGVSYHLKGDLKNASRYYNESLKGFEKIGDSLNVNVNYTHLGLIEKETDFNKGFRTQLKANDFFERNDPMHYNGIQNMGNLSKSYLQIYQTDSPVKNTGVSKMAALEKAYELSKTTMKRSRELGDIQNTVENLKNLAEIQFEKKHFVDAYKSLDEYTRLHDSLFSQESKNEIAALESEQELKLRDQKIKTRELEIEAGKRQTWYLFGGIAMLAVIGLLLYFQSRNRKRTNEKLQRLNEELTRANHTKTLFFSILNHDLRGPAASVVNYLRLQDEAAELIEPEKQQKYRDDTMNSAEYLLDTMEDLTLWCKSQMEHFSPTFETVRVSNLFDAIGVQFAPTGVSLEFINPDDVTLFTDEDYVLTILRNLTANSVKAFKGNPGKIIWKAEVKNDEVILSVTDNGPGANPEKFRALTDNTVVSGTRSGLGLHLIRELSQAIDAKVSFDTSPNGTSFTLKFDVRSSSASGNRAA